MQVGINGVSASLLGVGSAGSITGISIGSIDLVASENMSGINIAGLGLEPVII